MTTQQIIAMAKLVPYRTTSFLLMTENLLESESSMGTASGFEPAWHPLCNRGTELCLRRCSGNLVREEISCRSP